MTARTGCDINLDNIIIKASRVKEDKQTRENSSHPFTLLYNSIQSGNVVKLRIQGLQYLLLSNELAALNRTSTRENLLKKWFCDLRMNVSHIPAFSQK